MIMRIKYAKLAVFLIIVVNIVAVYYILDLFYAFSGFGNKIDFTNPVLQPSIKPLGTKSFHKLVTIIIREFDPNENDLTATVSSLLKFFPSIRILILFEEKPYPPLDFTLFYNDSFKNVQMLQLTPNLRAPYTEWYPIYHIKTEYALFIPDSTRITSRKSLHFILSEAQKDVGNILVAPFVRSGDLKCLNVNINTREWSLKFNYAKGLVCDVVSGKHLLIIKTEYLQKLANSFLEPFPLSFYIQTSSIFIKARILKTISFYAGKRPKSHHSQWKKHRKEATRLKQFYSLFKIKQVVRETGSIEWYGCNRDTPRCFGPVLDSMPSYLYEGKWTPPCCLSNLRKTGKHVFNVLDEAGIRFWLEAGSLLGAMRSGDILPWDHDIDIGFNTNDLTRSTWLVQAKERPTIDSKGFLWEKATEGNFYRVHYSKVNKIYVNLFPFYSTNGTMAQDSWYTSHKNMEFPDKFLHPMSSIDFIGRRVPSPNNIREFLELKFGRGCIESPRYPDPYKLKFP